jgi:hypothetical protein
MEIVILFLVIIVAPLAVGTVLVVLSKEYDWWATRLARWCILVAAAFQGLRHRARYRDEWLAELEELQRSEHYPGVMWAARLLLGAPRVRISRGLRVAPRLPHALRRAVRVFEPLSLFVTGLAVSGAASVAAASAVAGNVLVQLLAVLAVSFLTGLAFSFFRRGRGRIRTQVALRKRSEADRDK